MRFPVHFTNNIFAFIAAISRIFPHAERGQRLEADRVVFIETSHLVETVNTNFIFVIK